MLLMTEYITSNIYLYVLVMCQTDGLAKTKVKFIFDIYTIVQMKIKYVNHYKVITEYQRSSSLQFIVSNYLPLRTQRSKQE